MVRDQNGFRVCSPGRVAAATNGSGYSYAALAPLLPVMPPVITKSRRVKLETTKWLNLRPNVRYDW